MPITITITGNTGPETVQEMFSFLGNLQANLNGASAPRPPAAPVEDKPEVAEEPKKEAKKKAAEKPVEKIAEKPVEKAVEIESKMTLQEVMDLTKKAIVDSGDEAKGKIRVEKINEKFGIKKVRELPVDKLDAYAEAVKVEFPAKAEGEGMFD